MENRSNEIVSAFVEELFGQSVHDAVTAALEGSVTEAMVAYLDEDEEIVTLDLADVLYPAHADAIGAAYDGPPRAARKHAP